MTDSTITRPLVVKVDATHYPMDVFGDRLISEGFQVVKASSLKEGLKLVRRCKPDLVVTIDDSEAGVDSIEWLELQHSDSEASLVMTPLLILAENVRLDRLRVHELPDRVKVLQRPLELREFIQAARQMLQVWDI
jgi:chemotaxis response regulator CheB